MTHDRNLTQKDADDALFEAIRLEKEGQVQTGTSDAMIKAWRQTFGAQPLGDKQAVTVPAGTEEAFEFLSTSFANRPAPSATSTSTPASTGNGNGNGGGLSGLVPIGLIGGLLWALSR